MPRVRFRPPDDTPCARVDRAAGFTLVEVLVTIVVLTVGLLGTFAALRTSAHATLTNRERQAETSLAREVLEDAGSVPSWELSTSALPGALQPLITGSGSPVGGVLQVTRGPVTYSVTPTSCSIDDPTDGSGSHASGNPPAPNRTWCPNLTTSASPDATPDDEERVSVTVAPSAGATGSSVVQSTIIVNRPPVISAIAVAGGACTSGPPVTCTSAQPLTATATATTPAAGTTFQWFVNGALQAGMTTSQLTWKPPPGAASYTISAQAEYGLGPLSSAASVQVRVTS